MSMAVPLLEMKGIVKSFSGNRVLDGVDLAVFAGEVHALVGENGAGKSTLMKILYGIHTMDAGSIEMVGSPISLSNPHEAREAGVSMVFQEHTLAPHLTVAENVFLGIEPRRKGFVVDNARMRSAAAAVLAAHGFPLAASSRVAGLSNAGRQLVEIARALATAKRVVVMDEPTAALSRNESEELFRIIRELKGKGLAVVYISHKLEELTGLADRITILRDGRRVFSGGVASIESGEIIRHMVGREITALYPSRQAPAEETALDVRGLGDGRRYRGVSFALRRGEILGVAGLVGAGRTALAHGIFGLRPPREGKMLLGGMPVRFDRPGQAVRAGLAYLTEDRQMSGLFPHLSVVQNISVAALERAAAGIFLRPREEASRCGRFIRDLGIRVRSGAEPVCRLSGGNQQKALIARWLYAGSKVLILDEPTQGVDLGARAEIYRIIRDLAAEGAAVLMISSDLPEILGMSHRVLVMRRGEVTAELAAAETDQEEIMRFAALEAGGRQSAWEQ